MISWRMDAREMYVLFWRALRSDWPFNTSMAEIQATTTATTVSVQNDLNCLILNHFLRFICRNPFDQYGQIGYRHIYVYISTELVNSSRMVIPGYSHTRPCSS